MAALNFPDPNVTTTYTNPDTGITYEWSNNTWKAIRSAQTAPELFVDYDGDNMTGDLTFNTDKIVLGATFGTGTFASTVTANIFESTGRNEINLADDGTGLAIQKAGATVGNLEVEGDVYKIGAIRNSTGSIEFTTKQSGVTTPKLTIANDGSSTFANSIKSGGPTIIGGTNLGSHIGHEGNAAFCSGSTSSAIRVFEQGNSTATVDISGNGSATFAGNVQATDGTQYVKVYETGFVQANRTNGNNYVFEGRLSNSTTSSINGDGFAWFNSNIQTGGDPNNASADGIKLFSAGACYASRSSGDHDLFVGYQTGNTTPAIRLKANGSATFGGGNVALYDEGAADFVNTLSVGGGNYWLRSYNLDNQRIAQFNTDGSAYFASSIGIDTSNPLGILHTSLNATDGVGIYLENRADLGASDAVGIDFTLRRSGGYQFAGTRIRGVKENAWTGTPSTINSAITFSTFKSETASEKMRLDSSGRLLVGTPNFTGEASAVLEGSTAGETTQAQLWLNRGETDPVVDLALGQIIFGDATSTGSNGAMIQARTDGNWGGVNGNPTRLAFFTESVGSDDGPEERMRIESNGAIRTLSASHMAADFSTTSNASASQQALQVVRNRTGVAAGGSAVFRVYTNGDAKNTNGVFTSLSDERLKENIVDSGSQWEDIKAVRIRKWNFAEATGNQTHTQIGPVAQELELTSPGLVYDYPTTEDEVVLDKDGNEMSSSKGVHQSVLYMKAVKALQEAMDRIETLEAQNTDLLARVTALEAG